MRIVVTGATGLIGRALCRALAGAGHTVVGVGRRPGLVPAPIVTWDRLGEALRDAQAVVNLAGEPIAARRWTRAQKARIRDSRVLATRALVEGMAATSPRPGVLVSASAVGWYGPRGDEPLDETAPPGSGFLAEVCQAWEAEAERAATLGVRVVRLRIGVVLAPAGGALARLLLPIRAGLGGPPRGPARPGDRAAARPRRDGEHAAHRPARAAESRRGPRLCVSPPGARRGPRVVCRVGAQRLRTSVTPSATGSMTASTRGSRATWSLRARSAAVESSWAAGSAT